MCVREREREREVEEEVKEEEKEEEEVKRIYSERVMISITYSITL